MHDSYDVFELSFPHFCRDEIETVLEAQAPQGKQCIRNGIRYIPNMKNTYFVCSKLQ